MTIPIRLAYAKTYSENRKLGAKQMHVTYAAQVTCPGTCPFLGAGCYAESGHIGIYLARPMRVASAGVDPCAVAEAEARCIDALPATRNLRLHVLGDFHCEACARVLAAAVDRYIDRAPHRVRAFSYTHNHAIPREAFGRISILRSCETAAQRDQAHAAGFGVAMVLPTLPADGRAFMLDGARVIPCTYQTRGVSCADCRLCLDGDRLARERLVIGFAAHSRGREQVLGTISRLNGGEAA